MQHFSGAFERADQDLRKLQPLFGSFTGSLGAGPADRKHGAFHRFQHRFVGGLGSRLESMNDLIRIRLYYVFQRFGQSTEELGQDDAGVAPRPEEGASRCGLDDAS